MAVGKDEIELRFIESPGEIRAVGELEKKIWAGDQPVPYHMLLAVVHNGGVLIGAYDGDDLVGVGFEGVCYWCAS